MLIPHQRPGPSSLSTVIRPRNTKFLLLNLNKSEPATPVLASESTEDATVRQLIALGT